MTLEIRKAERRRAKARIGLSGPAGSGKTHSALLLASGLGNKIVVIDTERGSSEWEQGKSNMPDFYVCEINEPFTAKKYIDAIKECERLGYDVIIIDSLSHAWAGSGGLLDKQGEAADRLKNSYAAWREVTPLHNQLVDAMLQSGCHVIATMRSKTEYVLETNDKGKQQPRKVGMAPVQREGMDCEFTLVFDVDQSTHISTVSKNRLEIFKDGAEKLTKQHGEQLLAYINSGAAPVQHTPQPTAPQTTTTPQAQAAPAPTEPWDKSPEGLDLIESFRVLVRENLAADDQATWTNSFLKATSLTDAAAGYSRAKTKISAMNGATA